MSKRIFTASAVTVVVAAASATAALAGTDDTVATVAGTGVPGFNSATLASEAQVNGPTGITATADGGYVFADTSNSRIRKVSSTGVISTLRRTDLIAPTSVSPLPDQSGFIVADPSANRVFRLSNDGATLTVLAGTVSSGNSGDGGPATSAQLDDPTSALQKSDGLYIVDQGQDRIRRVVSGTISAFALSGSQSVLDSPSDIAVTVAGDLLVADTDNHRIAKVTTSGAVTTVAGTYNQPGYINGTVATDARLHDPVSVDLQSDGGFLVADRDNHAIRRVAPSGTVSTVLGTGTAGSNSATLATSAQLSSPAGVGVLASGDYLVSDTANHRVRKVSAPPTVVTPAPTSAPTTAPTAPIAPPTLTPTPTRTPDDAPEPKLGKTVGIAPKSGKVFFKASGGKGFVELTGDESVPVGSLINTTRGKVTLQTAIDAKGTLQTGTFHGGLFKVGQSAKAKGMTELTLRGGSFAACKAKKSSGRGPAARVAASKPKPARSLWSEDKGGKFRSRGRDSVATARGTAWVMQDRCDGTLTRVIEGRVAVRPIKGGKTVVVRAKRSVLTRHAG